MSISGKVAIVSGAAQGLGRAFAERLIAEGCLVLAFDVNSEVHSIKGSANVVADVSIRQDVEKLVEQAAAMGEIGVLVNNAGTWKRTPIDSPCILPPAFVCPIDAVKAILVSLAGVPPA